MPEDARDATPQTSTSENWVDVALYALAAISYISLAIYHKWLLDWIVGPLWCIAVVWGLPALWRLVRGQPVRPQRGRNP